MSQMPTNPTTITHNGERYVRLGAVLAVLNKHYADLCAEWVRVLKANCAGQKSDRCVTETLGKMRAMKTAKDAVSTAFNGGKNATQA